MGEASFGFNGLYFTLYVDYIYLNNRKYTFNMEGGLKFMFALKLEGFSNVDIKLLALKIKNEREQLLQGV